MHIILNELKDKAKDCSFGLLIMEGVQNSISGDGLAMLKYELETTLREKYCQAVRNDLRYPVFSFATGVKALLSRLFCNI